MWQIILHFFRRLFGLTPDTPVEPEADARSKKAVYVGINDYPGSGRDLAGCVNDCNDWVALTSTYGFTVAAKLLDAQATRKNVKNALKRMISGASKGDILLFTYSGHGSYVTDTSGDEPDGKDETLYLYDGHLTDDELRAILTRLPAGVSMTIILDSCHSGTGTRGARPDAPKIRFMPPDDYKVREIDDKLPTRKTMLSDEQMPEVLFTGCKNSEYSYDSQFMGRPNGAFTYFAIKTLEPGMTYQQWYNTIRKNLPNNDTPQTPQCEGSAANKAKIVFGGVNPLVQQAD